MDHQEQCDALELEIDRFATVYAIADASTKVPSCPAWNVHDLAEHLGMVHRWAEHLVRVRAQGRIARAEMNLDVGPVDIDWFREGGARLVATLREGDPSDVMWAWGADQHLAFWSRRQLHETFVHRLDLELAHGGLSVIDPVIAVDAIDEFLVNLEPDEDLTVRTRVGVERRETLLFRSIDEPRQWHLELLDEGFHFVPEVRQPDVTVSGGASDLALVLLRRKALAGNLLELEGDPTLFEYWLANSAFD